MAMLTTVGEIDLSSREFDAIRQVVHERAGIHLVAGKERLVQTRLAKRVRSLGLRSYGAYLERVMADRTGEELRLMIDVLTTNKTSFFREQAHFDFLQRTWLPEIQAARRELRIWSAGCSTGEEPYTIALFLLEHAPEVVRRGVRILATDISDRVLERARAGRYDAEVLGPVNGALRQRYFEREPDGRFRVGQEVSSLVSFARLNLVEQWPMRGPFDVIFCRNVMIYFDKPTQQRTVQRMWSLLREDGLLLVGHSESLTGIRHDYRYVQPAVYRR
jgi:chemotaxis protein methyltransferase CheR